MKKVFILYENFFTPDGQQLSIGGIQTYIKMLVKVIKDINMTPVIFQYASVDFKQMYNGVDVYGIGMKTRWRKNKRNQVLFDRCLEQYNSEKDIIVFACETMSVKNYEDRVIGIQHGITWDISKHEDYSHNKNLIFVFWRAIRAYKIVKRLKNIKVLIGVDYNFLNWYRTQVAYIETNVKVIPNCTEVYEISKKPSHTINIIFARRLQKHRGTRLFAFAANRILNKYDNVYITFAGSGPDENYLKELFNKNPKVNFITYDSEKSIEVHSNYQIAVIPTVGSEGTSFSLLEAMAAKCAVIASNVGGMTNIILDNYNGLLINPDEKQLYEAIEKLIINNELREKLANNAYHTVTHVFNKELWEEKWKKVLNEICDK